MAAIEIYANNPTTTVTSGGSTAGTSGTVESWGVTSSATFPAAATGVTQFHVGDPAQPSELIAVTNVAGTAWTVTRGAEATTPVVHAAGFTVDQVITAGGLNGLLSGASGPLAVTSGGTGGSSVTAYAVVTGGTTATSPFQKVSGVGTSGQVLTSAGTSALPIWQNAATAPQVAKYSGVSGQTPRESIPFYTASGAITAVAGQMLLSILPVSPGDVITNLGFVVNTAATFGTTASTQHWWTALYDSTAANLIAQSADQGTVPLTASTAHMLALGSPAPYTVPPTVTFLYAAVMVNVGTGGSPVNPTLRGPFFSNAIFDSTTSLFPTSRMYAATNGSGLGATAPNPGGTALTLAAAAGLVYFGAS